MRSAANVTAIKPLNRSAGLVPGVAFVGIPIVEMDSTASLISEAIAVFSRDAAAKAYRSYVETISQSFR